MSTGNERTGRDGMSKRTLPEELRSVLLANALQAPDPDETVRRVLTATSTAEAPPGTDRPRGWRRGNGRLLGAAAAIVVAALAGAGVVAAEHQHSDRGVNRAAAPPSTSSSSTAPGPRPAEGRLGPNGDNASRPSLGPTLISPQNSAPANPPAPSGVSCGSVPGSRLGIGSSATLPPYGYIYDFRCVAADGHRSASTVVAYTGRPGSLVERAVLVPAVDGAQVDFVAPVDQGVVVQLLAVDRSLQRLRFTSTDGIRFSEETELLAPPCTAADLTAALAPVVGASPAPGQQPPYVLRLTKHTGGICVLSGYPALTAGGSQARPTLHGPAGGTGWPMPEIVQLARGATVSALIEPGLRCAPAAEVTVTLPGGVALGALRAGFGLCGAQVHPVVPNERGTD